MIDPNMLALCREARGLTQSALGRECGFSQGYVSKLEAAKAEIDHERLATLTEALGVPVALLEAEIAAPSETVNCIHHRRRSSTMSASTRKMMIANAQLTQLSISRIGGVPHDSSGLRGVRASHLKPTEAARAVRQVARLSAGPIESVTTLVESLGVTIVKRSLGTRGQDAMSTWAADAGPMIVVSNAIPVDRLRFTLAHELGHLALHEAPIESQEDEANTFASEFLAPSDAIRMELEGLRPTEFSRLLSLKARWGLSIAALVRRARDLGIFGDDEYRTANIELARLGWKRVEPGHAGIEPETWFARHCDDLAQELGGIEAASALALVTVDVFSRDYLGKPVRSEEAS